MPKFVKGQIANPKGRPKNTGHRQILYNSMVMPEKENMMRKAIELAKEGDTKMLIFFLERLLPPPTRHADSDVEFSIPDSINLADTKSIAMQVIKLVNDKYLTVEQGTQWLELLKNYKDTALGAELSEIAKTITDKHKEVKSLPVIEGIDID